MKTKRTSLILNLIQKEITEKIYKKAREKEKEFSQNEFTAYYLPQTVILWFVAFLLLLTFALLCDWLKGDRIIVILLIVAGIGSFSVFIYHLTYRCFVNDYGMTVAHWGFIKKSISWKEVYKIEVKRHAEEYDSAEERDLIIKNKKNKIIFSCSYELVGFTLIEKKAKKESKKPH